MDRLQRTHHKKIRRTRNIYLSELASIYPPVVVLVCASQRELPTMFLLSVVEDNIKVSPEQFGRDLTEVIIEQLEIKYLNKVSIYLPICIHYTLTERCFLCLHSVYFRYYWIVVWLLVYMIFWTPKIQLFILPRVVVINSSLFGLLYSNHSSEKYSLGSLFNQLSKGSNYLSSSLMIFLCRFTFYPSHLYLTITHRPGFGSLIKVNLS